MAHRFLPTLIYPVLTVLLIIQLRRIKKKRAAMLQNSPNKVDNTTSMILLMTITFMLSEGLSGTIGIININSVYFMSIDYNENLK